MTADPPRRPLKIHLVAAEESGDALGASLARALSKRQKEPVELGGVGGRAMAAAGIASPFVIDELSIVGVTTIPRRLPVILRRIRETADAVIASRPDALVIIDSPDFSHRVARRVRRRAPSIPILDYVSPSVWAWRPGRARAMRAYIDCVLAILPFEPATYVQLGGPPCVYVGHPLVERVADLRPGVAEAARRQTEPPLVLVLPGSRTTEIARLSAIFGAAIAKLVAGGPTPEFVLPTMPHLLGLLRRQVEAWPVRPRIVAEPSEKWAAFRAARAALAASGTVTLELAVSGVPTVVAYRLPLIEEAIVRLAGVGSRISSVVLANLVIGENIVPEFLQRRCTAENLAGALLPLLSESDARRRQIDAFARLDSIMAIGRAVPSDHAAAIVLDFARRGRHAPVAAANAGA